MAIEENYHEIQTAVSSGIVFYFRCVQALILYYGLSYSFTKTPWISLTIQ